MLCRLTRGVREKCPYSGSIVIRGGLRVNQVSQAVRLERFCELEPRCVDIGDGDRVGARGTRYSHDKQADRPSPENCNCSANVNWRGA